MTYWRTCRSFRLTLKDYQIHKIKIMENNTLQPKKENDKTVELEPGQSLRIKLTGDEENQQEVKLNPAALKQICGWIGKSFNDTNSDYLESCLNEMANAVCFFTDNAICEDIKDQPSHFDNIQAVARIHQDLIKFLI